MTNVNQFLLLDDAGLLSDCDVDTYRAGGPGGQKRNKTSSAVRLRHRPTGLTAIGVEDRSQHVNKARALRRLRETIALEARMSELPDDYAPSELMRSYCRVGKLRISTKNPDFPRIVEEVLRVFTASRLSVSQTAKALGLTTGHLVSYFASNPRLWRCVSTLRKEGGMRPLRAAVKTSS